MSIAPPNYTQFPNEILDAMPRMKEAEWRVACAICRKTFGWQKREDLLSLSQLMKLTGLSRQGVIQGIEQALEHGYVGRSKAGQSYKYRLEISEPGEAASQPSGLDKAQTSQPSGLELVNVVDTQKILVNKVLKDKAQREPAAPKPERPVDNNLFAIAQAIAQVAHMDFEANKPQLFREAKLLAKATAPAPTPELILTHFNGNPAAFWKSRWPGNTGQLPKPSDIRKAWGQWDIQLEGNTNGRSTQWGAAPTDSLAGRSGQIGTGQGAAYDDNPVVQGLKAIIRRKRDAAKGSQPAILGTGEGQWADAEQPEGISQ